MPIDVILEIEKIRDPYSGLGQFCSELTKAIGENNFDLKISAIAPPDHLISGINMIKERRQLFKYRLFNPKAKLWHLTHQDPRYKPPYSTPYVLTIHDLNDLIEKPTEAARIRPKLQELISNASHIVCISNFTKQAVLQQFKVTAPMSVIPNGVPQIAESVSPTLIPKRPFFFNVGTVLAKKNVHTIVEIAPLMPEYDFVIAGSISSEYAKSLITKKVKNVFFTGTISAAHKAYYLRNCHGFIFPSLLEGFGIPIVEAMSCGKPLFLSQETSVPETGGTDAFYFEDFTPGTMKQTILDGLEVFDEARSERLIARSHNFTWQQAALSYLEIYRGLIQTK